ncbi:hypothetical protein GF337_03795 [candidate division KSB1 bacterium]|nr:hypothetical protein [candidate division KSB1 bacterium]
MDLFFLLISSLALFISKFALFYFLVFSFFNELHQMDENKTYINRQSRKIKRPLKDEQKKRTELKILLIRRKTLLPTIVIAEIIGYILYMISTHPMRFTAVETNAFLLLYASVICQALTIANGWLRIRMNLSARLMFQLITLSLGILWLKILSPINIVDFNQLLLIFVIIYFGSVMVAIYSMLADALFSKQGIYRFDFNHYFRLVIFIGLIVGSVVYFNFDLQL